MPNTIHAQVAQIEPILQTWTAETASSLTHMSTNLMALKQMLTRCISALKTEFTSKEESALTNSIQTQLTGLTQYISSYTNPSYYAQCVVHAFELDKLLHSYGYFNHRVSKIINDSLANRKQAAKAFTEITNTATEIKTIKTEIDGYNSEIESFYNQCFVDDEGIESYKSQFEHIKEVHEEIFGDDGFLEQIKSKNTEANTLRDEILELKTELIDGDDETDSVKVQIDELVEDLEANQNKISSFITEYITGSTTVSKDKEGEEVITKTKSKKELVDELHKQFEVYIADEKKKIDDYILAFDKYKDAKKQEIEGLLKAATNASLAHAFGKSRDAVQQLKIDSEKRFQWMIVALVAILAITYILQAFGLWPKSDVWYVAMLYRASFISPVIWIAYSYAKKANQYFRLEHEYEHKEVVSRSFEGYKSQVLELYEDDQTSKELLEKLLEGSIQTIAKNPAEVLDKVKDTGHPLDDFDKKLSGIVEPLSKISDLFKK